MFYACGFNGFGQFSLLSCKEASTFCGKLQQVRRLCLSWNGLYYIADCGKVTGVGLGQLDQLSVDVYNDFACSASHIATVSKQGVATESMRLVKCYVGDMDVVFVSDGAKAIWIALANLELQVLPIARPIVSVSCGKEHVLLLVDDGSVYSFGHGSRGQLGHGDLDREYDPKPIECLQGLVVTCIAAGGWHSAAVTEGDLYTWGWNESGQLGFATKTDHPATEITLQATPKCVDFPKEVLTKHVTCGSRHTAVLMRDSSAWSFGWNSHGQLGRSSLQSSTGIPGEVTLGQAKDFSDVCCGGWSTVFRR